MWVKREIKNVHMYTYYASISLILVKSIIVKKMRENMEINVTQCFCSLQISWIVFATTKWLNYQCQWHKKLYKTRYNTKTTIGLLVNGLLTYILHNQSRNLNASITLIDMFFFCSALMIQVHSMGTEYFTENSRCSSEMFAVPTMKMMLFYRDQLCIFWRL